MGQRLNIEIVANSEPLANSYYHWSGYTSSSLELTKVIIEAILNEDVKINELNTDSTKELCNATSVINKYMNDNILNACLLLRATGAKLTEDEIEYIKNIYGDSCSKVYDEEEIVDRNDGLIAVSENGMRTTRCWEEARVTIDILNKTIDFDAVWFDSIESYENEYDENIGNLTKIDFDFTHIEFSEFQLFYETIMHLVQKESAVLCRDEIIMFIE